MPQYIPLNRIQQAAKAIQDKQLLAFPTQTVYGLGANAYYSEAIQKIFLLKKRPLTDPIIVHILNSQQALQLFQFNPKQQVIFKILSKRFWPGPLTFVSKGNWNKLPKILGGGTQYIGIRSPKNQTARKLLQLSGVPIAAPSANLFGHVSPTSQYHVYKDFQDSNLKILQGEICQYGIQSTVMKITQQGHLQILRMGSVQQQQIKLYLLQSEELKQVKIRIITKINKVQQCNEAPGQILKHYSPYVPCYILQQQKMDKKYDTRFEYSKCAFLSFSKEYEHFRKEVKHYIEVGKHFKDIKQQIKLRSWMRQLYGLLRECQQYQIQVIIIGWDNKISRQDCIYDKLFRASEGKQIYNNQDGFVC